MAKPSQVRPSQVELTVKTFRRVHKLGPRTQCPNTTRNWKMYAPDKRQVSFCIRLLLFNLTTNYKTVDGHSGKRREGAQKKKTNQRTKQKPRTKRAPTEWKIECDTRQSMAVGLKELKLNTMQRYYAYVTCSPRPKSSRAAQHEAAWINFNASANDNKCKTNAKFLCSNTNKRILKLRTKFSAQEVKTITRTHTICILWPERGSHEKLQC